MTVSSEQAPTPRELIESLRELWLTDSDLGFLAELDPTVLACIHVEVSAHAQRVHDSQRKLYAVLAGATRFIPNFVIARMSSALSPYVLAQVSEHMEPKAAAGLAKTFDAHVLSEIVLHIDTQTAARIAVHTDLDMLVQITESLANKGLLKRLGEISDALEERVLEKLVVRIHDPERIAAVASHMQELTKLTSIGRRLDRKLVLAIIQALQRAGNGKVAQALQA
jgi:hypothetical protein